MTAPRRVPATDMNKPLDPLMEEALAWLVQLHSGSASESDWAAYAAWKVESAAQARAAVSAEQLWSSLGQAVKPPSSLSRRAVLGLAAVTGTGLLAYGGWSAAAPGAFAGYRTATGTRQTLTLADGSVLDMDAATRLDIDYSAELRQLILHEGQIHVSVSPDRQRPFEVVAGDGRIRALGTAFNVRRRGDAVDVVVTEHAVRVRWPSAPAVEVGEGQAMRFGPDQGLTWPVSADVDAMTAWRRGYLIFDDQPLGEVMADMARYHPGWVIVREPSLRALRITGVFGTDNAKALLDAIVATLPVRVRYLPFVALIEPA